jgi:hypothetical protein
MPGRNPRALEEVTRAAKKVSEKVDYPIRNFNQAARALGGDEAEFEFGGRRPKVKDAKPFVSNDYFPIDSEEDLIAKIHDIQLRSGGGEPTDGELGEPVNEAPADAGEPPADSRPSPAPGNKSEVPHLKGHGRRR